MYEFLYVFLPESESDATSIRVKNLLSALPNDDDLEQTYRKDRKDYLAAKYVTYISSKRFLILH